MVNRIGPRGKVTMPLETFGEEKLYNLERIGSFGKFYTGNSFPIEYLMTTFSSAELSELTLARDIQPEHIDFELLLQRDIDEERVRSEMEPYLNPQQLTPSELRSRAVFFPPLLAAIVPTKGKVMAAYYTDEQGDIQVTTDKQKQHIIREWPGLFKLTYFASNSPGAYRLHIYKGQEEDTIEVGVQREPVQLEIRLAKGNQSGSRLVIIDGQHRLFTLKKVYEKHPELLENLGVPVCILFAPNSTEQKNREYASLIRVPTVPEVFRHLFVDVNSTAKQVSGHFNILLSDDSIGNITCRKFCDDVLTTKDHEGLAVIEWNTKNKKHSTIITRSYSLTSIGIIDKALAESIGSRKSLLKYLLNLEEIKPELYPNGEDDLDYPTIQWDKFSLSQKPLIEQQIDNYLIPCLELIFFQTATFSTAFKIFLTHLNKLKKLANSDQQDAIEARPALAQIIDYLPIGEGKTFDGVRLVYKNFETAVAQEREAKLTPIIQYALFQRALFEAWAQLLEIGRSFSIDPRPVTKGFTKLLELALQTQGRLLAVDRLYMQYTVFAGNRIIGREETKRSLTQLLLAPLGNPAYAEMVGSEIGVTAEEVEALVERLQERGQIAALEFQKNYEAACKRTFKTNYRLDLSIKGPERDELIEAEEEQKRHLRELKEGCRTKAKVSNWFDDLVEEHLKEDIELAIAELTEYLGYAN